MIKKKSNWWALLTPEEKQKIIEKRKRTNLAKYGVENPSQRSDILEKKKKTWLGKYGVENPSQNKEIQEKKKITCLENNGVEYPAQSKIIKEKQEKTCLEKYGVKNPYQQTTIKEKKRRNSLKKYGVENPFQSSEIQNEILIKNRKIFYHNFFENEHLKNLIKPLFTFEEYTGTKNKKYSFRCLKCDTIFKDRLNNGHAPRCYKCFPISQFTKPHKLICDYLEENNIKFEVEKYINPYSVDIFIEPNKIIEIYGDYWHANPKLYQENDKIYFTKQKFVFAGQKWENDKMRTEYLEKQNNKILILWENEIKNNFELVKEKINIFEAAK